MGRLKNATKQKEIKEIKFRHPTVEEIQEAIRIERETIGRQPGDVYFHQNLYNEIIKAIMIRNGGLTGIPPYEGASN